MFAIRGLQAAGRGCGALPGPVSSRKTRPPFPKDQQPTERQDPLGSQNGRKDSTSHVPVSSNTAGTLGDSVASDTGAKKKITYYF